MLTRNPLIDFDETFGWIDFSDRRSVVLAVSGGSDSTALLIAFKRWANVKCANIRPVCVTIDHRIRSDSALEARQVASVCERIGIDHRTMVWQADKPSSGLPAAAREARYRLLAEAARELETDIIMTGHTADDQAETVFMRSARGADRGLAGMARLTLFGGRRWIARPFLTETRETLRDVLRAEGISWIDDPTNTDRRYERVQVRSQLEHDPNRHSWMEKAGEMAFARTRMSAQSADLIDTNAVLLAPGLIKAGLPLLNTDDTSVDALRFLLACCGGRAHPASRSDNTRLIDRLSAGRASLSGSVVTRMYDSLYIHRELRSDRPLRFRDGIFDNRYRLSPAAVSNGWRLRARSSIDDLPEIDHADIPASLVKAAWKAEPVLGGEQTESASKSSNTPEMRPYLAPFDHFLPEFDLTLACALARLFKHEPYPSAPVRGQK